MVLFLNSAKTYQLYGNFNASRLHSQITKRTATSVRTNKFYNAFASLNSLTMPNYARFEETGDTYASVKEFLSSKKGQSQAVSSGKF